MFNGGTITTPLWVTPCDDAVSSITPQHKGLSSRCDLHLSHDRCEAVEQSRRCQRCQSLKRIREDLPICSDKPYEAFLERSSSKKIQIPLLWRIPELPGFLLLFSALPLGKATNTRSILAEPRGMSNMSNGKPSTGSFEPNSVQSNLILKFKM